MRRDALDGVARAALAACVACSGGVGIFLLACHGGVHGRVAACVDADVIAHIDRAGLWRRGSGGGDRGVVGSETVGRRSALDGKRAQPRLRRQQLAQDARGAGTDARARRSRRCARRCRWGLQGERIERQTKRRPPGPRGGGERGGVQRGRRALEKGGQRGRVALENEGEEVRAERANSRVDRLTGCWQSGGRGADSDRSVSLRGDGPGAHRGDAGGGGWRAEGAGLGCCCARTGSAVLRGERMCERRCGAVDCHGVMQVIRHLHVRCRSAGLWLQW